MKKQLYFYFYTRRDTLFSEVNQIHFKCLEYYRNVFDEAFICISIDDINDEELIKDTQTIFFDIFKGKTLSFKVMQNNQQLCESMFFHEEILDNLDKLDLVFFAHGKGVTNITDPRCDRESLLHWIVGLYYGSLNNYYCAINKITRDTYFTCGSFYTKRYDMRLYSGTFYWMNTKRINTYVKRNKIDLPKLSNRYEVEYFPYNINMENEMCSVNNKCLVFDIPNYVGDFWVDTKEYCKILGYNTKEFYDLYDFVVKK
jgi:hypothetical protein